MNALLENNQMKVLILGGCGFIGKHLVQALSEDRTPLVVFDIHAQPDLSSQACIFIQGEFSELEKLEAVIGQHRITHVIHLVSTTLPKSSNEDMPYDLSSNVIQTLHLLDLCVRYRVKKILFMSSGGTIYGAPSYVPVDESHPQNPICSYGISKLAIEKYLFLYHHLYGLSYVALRAANPYGPGQNPLSGQGIIPTFVQKMCADQPLEVWGDGSTIRDYIDVRDLVKLTRLALVSNEVGSFNAGSGTGVSINDLIRSIAAVVRKRPNVLYKPQRAFDVPAITLDCSKSQKTFSWRPEISLDIGVADYFKWHEDYSH